MKQYHVFLSDAAYADLNRAVSYLKHELLEPHAANALIDEMQNTIEGLSQMPYRYEIVSQHDIADIPLRKCMVGNYLLFYSIEESDKCVNIIRILYSRRDWMNILS